MIKSVKNCLSQIQNPVVVPRKQFFDENVDWSLITRLKGALALFEISNVRAQKMFRMIFVTLKNFAPIIYKQLLFKNSIDW